jgi:hypothetical protein
VDSTHGIKGGGQPVSAGRLSLRETAFQRIHVATDPTLAAERRNAVSRGTTTSEKDANRFGQAVNAESLEQLMRAHEELVHHIVRQQ